MGLTLKRKKKISDRKSHRTGCLLFVSLCSPFIPDKRGWVRRNFRTFQIDSHVLCRKAFVSVEAKILFFFLLSTST